MGRTAANSLGEKVSDMVGIADGKELGDWVGAADELRDTVRAPDGKDLGDMVGAAGGKELGGEKVVWSVGEEVGEAVSDSACEQSVGQVLRPVMVS